VGLGLIRDRGTLAGLALVLVSSCAYGITPALIKFAYRADLEELSLIGLRSGIGAVLVWAVARAVGEPRVRASAALRLATLGAALYGPQMWLYFASLRWLDTGVAVAAVYVYPAIVAVIMAVRLRRPPPAVEVVLVGLAVLGIAIIALSAGPSRIRPLGVALALVTALLYAIYLVVAASVTADAPTLGSTAWVLVGAAASTVAAAAVTGRLALPSGGLAWGYVLVHGVVVVPVGLVAFYAGLRRLGPTRTALVDTVQPVIAVAIGMAVLGEGLDAGRAIGIPLVVLAVVAMPVLAGRAARQGAVAPSA
jgi:drug/metabolite transporter (DMT)-like permease